MSENNRKRSGSFRRLFPYLFRNKGKHKEARLKVENDEKHSTQYLNPRSMIRTDKLESSDTERIYENLSIARHDVSKNLSLDISSNHSSSSTLVSDSVRNRSLDSYVSSDKYNVYAARPQVPPKPNPHVSDMNPDVRNRQRADNSSQYPDVYYHPIENLVKKKTAFDEIEIYKATPVQQSPTSVGAEIKRVSTKFLISPKKDAEVRTIQPTRARSLSFDRGENNRAKPPQGKSNLGQTTVKKYYNYSAPTSPVPTSHRIPYIPKTVSPYELLRKNLSEAEQKKNTPSNQSDSGKRQGFCQSPNATSILKENGTLDKEKTRQKVEAFYWQKLKEMKDKEDEFYMRQSINSSIGAIGSQEQQYARNSNCSTPIPSAVQLRSSSLPRGRDMLDMMNQQMYAAPFKRGTPERRTDTYFNSRSHIADPEIIYRRTEELNSSMARQEHVTTPIFHRGSLTKQNSIASPPKRVSFDENSSVESNYSVNRTKVGKDVYSSIIQRKERPTNVHVFEQSRRPPQPPVRTTSVGVKNFKLVNNKRINYLFGTGHSESESGSEAGEIQRILQNRRDMLDMMNQQMYAAPFKRGTPERRTDTYFNSRSHIADPEIIYRRTEELNSSMARQEHVTTPIFHRGSLTKQNSIASPPKRVSFDENSSVESNYSVNRTKVGKDVYSSIIQRKERPTNVHVFEQSRRPPQPPVRTTSVGVKNFKLVNNKRINYLFGTGHSESESGSEAGEIQRILQNRE